MAINLLSGSDAALREGLASFHWPLPSCCLPLIALSTSRPSFNHLTVSKAIVNFHLFIHSTPNSVIWLDLTYRPTDLLTFGMLPQLQLPVRRPPALSPPVLCRHQLPPAHPFPARGLSKPCPQSGSSTPASRLPLSLARPPRARS